MVTVDASFFDTLPEAAAYYTDALDSFAGHVRTRFLSSGVLVDQEYLQTANEAQAYADAGYSGAVPDSVQSWADAAGMTAQAACDDILASRAAYQGAMRAVRRHRLVGKAAIQAAATKEDAQAAFDEYRGYLDAIQPPQ